MGSACSSCKGRDYGSTRPTARYAAIFVKQPGQTLYTKVHNYDWLYSYEYISPLMYPECGNKSVKALRDSSKTLTTASLTLDQFIYTELQRLRRSKDYATCEFFAVCKNTPVLNTDVDLMDGTLRYATSNLDSLVRIPKQGSGGVCKIGCERGSVGNANYNGETDFIGKADFIGNALCDKPNSSSKNNAIQDTSLSEMQQQKNEPNTIYLTHSIGPLNL